MVKRGRGQGSGKRLASWVKTLTVLQVFTQYREHGVMMWRGYTILQMAHQARHPALLHCSTPRPPRHTVTCNVFVLQPVMSTRLLDMLMHCQNSVSILTQSLMLAAVHLVQYDLSLVYSCAVACKNHFSLQHVP